MFQVQVRFGKLWRFWSLLRCKTAMTHQMFSYGRRDLPTVQLSPSFLQKIDLWVSFPIPPVWGQSASYSRSYDRFTEERYVCLARWSCRGDERMLIDDTALLSFDGDPTRRAEPITWPTYAQKLPQVTRIPLDDSEPYLCVF